MANRILVTGGAGFIGRELIRQLRDRGDDVVAVVRNPDHIDTLRRLGAMPVAGDLGWTDEIRATLGGCVPRIVYLSTVNAFGNTRGRIVDESYRREPADGFGSYYDETKYLGHVAAETRIASGAPVLIVQPGATYGPGDHSAIGRQPEAAFRGSARVIVFGDLGIAPVHVEDLVSGILAALDQGRSGESYVLAGHCVRLGDAMAVAARAGGHGPPRFAIPTALARLAVPMGRLAVRVGTLRMDVGEIIRVGRDVARRIAPGLVAVVAVLSGMLLAGCRLPENALDGPLAVPLRVTATPTTIEVDAPTWFAPETAVYLCLTEPAALPEPGPGRVGWQPRAGCHDFGRRPTPDGLRTVLDLGELSDAERGHFEVTATWYLLLVRFDGDRATSAIHTSFGAPGGYTD